MKTIGELFLGTKVMVTFNGRRSEGMVCGRTNLKEYLYMIDQEVREAELARLQSEYGAECFGFVVYHVAVEDSVIFVESNKCEVVSEERGDTIANFV